VAPPKRSSQGKARATARRRAQSRQASRGRRSPLVIGIIAVMVVTLVLAIVLPLVVGSGGGDDSSFDPAAAFAQRCATCHGATGGGAIGPQLSGGAVVRKYPNIDDQIAVVEHGRGGMPGFQGKGLSDSQIRKIVEYTRTDL
jgi:mono/diheme cytochrome c family protein